jgi:hypothetical protein
MSATPYELRAQLLQQAEGILTTRYTTAVDKIRFEQACLEKMNNKEITNELYLYPKFPTTEDIIVEAEKLYRFVQTK